VHRRFNEGQPAGIAFGGVIAVLVAVADGSERAPEVVRRCPEAGDLGLLGRALAAAARTERLDLVVVAGLDAIPLTLKLRA
jgi:hypothetical protein